MQRGTAAFEGGKSWRPALYWRLGYAAGVAWAEVIQSGAASFMHTGKPVVGPSRKCGQSRHTQPGKVSRNRAVVFAAPRVQDGYNRGFVKTKGATTHCVSGTPVPESPRRRHRRIFHSRLRIGLLYPPLMLVVSTGEL
jgi:hypothetical protein